MISLGYVHIHSSVLLLIQTAASKVVEKMRVGWEEVGGEGGERVGS